MRIYHSLIFFFWITAIGFMGSNLPKHLGIKTKEFHFKNYENPREIEAILTTLHPPGSDAYSLHKTLINGGAHCNLFTYPKHNAAHIDELYPAGCEYLRWGKGMFQEILKDEILVMITPQETIESISVYRNFSLP